MLVAKTLFIRKESGLPSATTQTVTAQTKNKIEYLSGESVFVSLNSLVASKRVYEHDEKEINVLQSILALQFDKNKQIP
jgi:hypothetical protein